MPSFYERVEILCKRLSDSMPHGDDRNAIDKLGEEAAEYQSAGDKDVVQVLDGIGDEIRSL